MTFIHLARCKGICSLIYLVIKNGATATDLILICGSCINLKPIAKEKQP